MREPSNGRSDQDQSNPKELAREIHWVEKATMWSQISLGMIGIIALIVYNGQLKVMRGTLEEMKRSGKAATDQTWRAIDNMNWLARTMDGALKESQRARISTETQSGKALNATIDTLRTDQRAWVSVGRIPNTAVVFEPEKLFVSNLALINTGKTPTRVLTKYKATTVLVGKVLDFADKLRAVKESPQIFGPGFSAPLVADGNTGLVSKATYELVSVSKTLNLLVYGRADYVDAFGFKHWITFSYLYDPSTKDLVPYRSDMDRELR